MKTEFLSPPENATNQPHRGALEEEIRNEHNSRSSHNNSRVLIVDDNSRFARSAQLFLEHTGNYFACVVDDPRRALETARSFKPDLVVVDLIMPQADGLEVATQLEADWALHEVPIVFVTALITREEARDGRRVEGHRVVPKPGHSRSNQIGRGEFALLLEHVSGLEKYRPAPLVAQMSSFHCGMEYAC